MNSMKHNQSKQKETNPPLGYIDVTAVCQAAGKEFSNYRQNQLTHAHLRKVVAESGCSLDQLIVSHKKHTWAHPDIAKHVTYWADRPSLIKDPAGLVYAVTSPAVDLVKVGHWRGDIPSLKSRYRVYYTRDMQMVYAQVQDCASVEDSLLSQFHAMSLGGELFKKGIWAPVTAMLNNMVVSPPAAGSPQASVIQKQQTPTEMASPSLEQQTNSNLTGTEHAYCMEVEKTKQVVEKTRQMVEKTEQMRLRLELQRLGPDPAQIVDPATAGEPTTELDASMSEDADTLSSSIAPSPNEAEMAAATTKRHYQARSKYYGVLFEKGRSAKGRRWRVQFCVSGTKYRGTYHHTDKEASRAARKLAKEHGLTIPKYRPK